MKSKWIGLCLAAVVGSTAVGWADDAAIAWSANLEAALSKAKADKKPALVVVASPKAKQFNQLLGRALADEMVVKSAGKYVAVKLDAESNKEAVAKYKLSSPVGVAVVDPEGAVIARKYGVSQDAAKFADWLDGIESNRKQLKDELDKVKANPKDVDLLKRAGVLMGVLGDAAAAADLLNAAEKAVGADDFAQLCNDVADSFQEEWGFDQAIAIFRRAEKHANAKYKGYALGSIATCYMQSGRLPQAKKEFEATLKIEGLAEDLKRNCEQSLEQVNAVLDRAKESEKGA